MSGLIAYWWESIVIFLYGLKPGRWVGLVEVIKDDASIGMISLKPLPYPWMVRIANSITRYLERERGDKFDCRTVSPERAEKLLTYYAEWVKIKNEAPKMAKQIEKWATKSGARKTRQRKKGGTRE
jgi:hypothetical protein